MDCLCTETCFIDWERDKAQLFQRGEVHAFKKCPEYHFEPVDSVKVDFTTATEELLNADAGWDEDELKDFIMSEFGVRVHPNIGRNTLVKKLMDARYRSIDV